ncbi:MAG TPA: CPBP family intramembrane metalloprotease [Candidatus Omnitrophota bacterium]|nr:CPBP family intramembrane metalloprotease [Candidatus Omnitrophota bacterium]
MAQERKKWLLYLILAFLGIGAWIRFSYPSFSFIDLKISRKDALKTARDYLRQQRAIDPGIYTQAVVLGSESAADRYLQKTLGFAGEQEFIAGHRFDLFSWRVRFFQEGKKEEYRISVSASTGKITGFLHLIEDTAHRPEASVEKSYALAQQFLSQQLHADLNGYTLKEKTTKEYDNRADHSFSWQKDNVSIPWSREKNAGTGKLLIKIRASGNDILSFDTNVFDVPDDFKRFIANAKQSGRILTNIFSFFSYLLIIAATYTLVTKRQNLILQITQPFYVAAGVLLCALLIIFQFNNIQDMLYDYPTTSSLKVYFSELSLGLLVTGSFLAIMMVVPAMAGEAIAQENTSRCRGFAHYLQSTFFSRHTAAMIALGYAITLILLGLQSVIFHIGQTYWGVWIERPHVTQASSAILPFVTILIVAFRASICEETLYRLFGIEYGKKLFKNIFLACLAASVIWGFGHSHYQIFPSWFRGIEVSLLGLVLSFFYVRYGMIPVVISHFIFDAFWGSAGFIFGKAQPWDLFSCLLVICLPLIFTLIAFVLNRPDVLKQKAFFLNAARRHNIKILSAFLSNRNNFEGKNITEIREELLHSGWDPVVIDKAIEETEKCC